jgi:multiple sugar transport system ATP-binding protein
MGNPTLNCFRAEVVYQENEWHAQTSGFCLPLGKDKYQNNDKVSHGKSVILGIRPEHFYTLPFLPPGLNVTVIRAQVTLVENLGHEVILYLQTLPDKNYFSESFTARVDPRTRFKEGEIVDIGVHSQQAHLFDPETELRIPKES